MNMAIGTNRIVLFSIINLAETFIIAHANDIDFLKQITITKVIKPTNRKIKATYK